MSDCKDLASKQELEELKSRLASLENKLSDKLDKSEKPSIIESANQKTKLEIAPHLALLGNDIGNLRGLVIALQAAILLLEAGFSGLKAYLDERNNVVNGELAILREQISQLLNWLSNLAQRLGQLPDQSNVYARIAALEAKIAQLEKFIYNDLYGQIAGLNIEVRKAYALANDAIGRANAAIALANEAIHKANQALGIGATNTENIKRLDARVRALNDLVYSLYNQLVSAINSLQGQIEALKIEINTLLFRFQLEVDSLKNDFQSDIADLRSEFNQRIASIELQVSFLSHEVARLREALTQTDDSLRRLYSSIISLNGQTQQATKTAEDAKKISEEAGNTAYTAHSIASTNTGNINNLFSQNDGLFANDTRLFSQNDGLFAQNQQLFENDKKLFANDDNLFANDNKLFNQTDTLFKNDTQLFENDKKLFANDDNLFSNLKTLSDNDVKLFSQDDGLFKNDTSIFSHLALIDNRVGINTLDIGNLQKVTPVINEQQLGEKIANDLKIGLLPLFNNVNNNINTIKPPINEINNNVKPNNIKELTKQGICESTNGGCMNEALNNNSNNTADKIKNLLPDAGLAAQAAANQAILLAKLAEILALLYQILGKFAPILAKIAELYAFVSDKFGKLFKSNVFDRALGLLNLALGLHNALQLTNNIALTVESMMNNILGTIGLKDADGNEYEIGAIINKSVTDIVRSVVGGGNYSALSEEFKKANRIYQASSNLLSTIQSMQYAVQDSINTVGQYTGKIGNALIKYGALPEKAYDWMNDKFSLKVGRLGVLQKAVENLEGATTIASSLEQISGDVLQVSQDITQLKEQKKEFDDSFKDITDKKKDDEMKAKTDSTGSNIKTTDLVQP
jgi:hypothetical protein